MNFVVAPGQDTIVMDNRLENFLCGLSHQYLYDFEMLKIMLSNCGFNEIKQMKFCKSALPELEKPLVVQNVQYKMGKFKSKIFKKK